MLFPNKCFVCKYDKNFQSLVTDKVYGDTENKKSFFRCENCEIIYQFPKFTNKDQKKMYAIEFENYMDKRVGKKIWKNPDLNSQHNIETKNRRIKYLKKYINKKYKNILEFGAASGFMLEYFKNKKYKCYAVEPSILNQNHLSQNNIKAYNSLQNLKKNNKNIKFDLITHYFVLEHVVDPYNFLFKQTQLLKKGGKIIFEIPCYNDALYKIYNLQKFENFYWSKVHNYYFNKNSLNALLKKFNLKYHIFYDQRYDLSNHLYWCINGKPGGTKYFTDKLGTKIEKLYKQNLINQGFADTLIGILIK